MHASGHDGHTAIAIRIAEIMSARRAEVAGTSVFIFQPAEEVISGAEPMIAAGVLDDPHVDESGRARRGGNERIRDLDVVGPGMARQIRRIGDMNDLRRRSPLPWAPST
jgi:hypothetical protein